MTFRKDILAYIYNILINLKSNNTNIKIIKY